MDLKICVLEFISCFLDFNCCFNNGSTFPDRRSSFQNDLYHKRYRGKQNEIRMFEVRVYVSLDVLSNIFQVQTLQFKSDL